jgi:hypothetical protein
MNAQLRTLQDAAGVVETTDGLSAYKDCIAIKRTVSPLREMRPQVIWVWLRSSPAGTITCAANAASRGTSIAPGEILSILGTSIGPDTAAVASAVSGCLAY